MLPGKKYLPEDILWIAWRRKWFIVIPFIAVSSVTAVVSHFLPNRYRSEAIIAIQPQKVPESYVKSTVTTRTEDRLAALYARVRSRTNLERAIQQFNLYPRERRFGIMEDVVEQMKKDIVIESIKGDAFRVAYVNQDRRLAKAVADLLAGMIIDESRQDRTSLAQSTTDFLATQLEEVRRRLEAQEKLVADYKVAHAGELPTERESNLQAQANAQIQIQNLVQQMGQDADKRYRLEKYIEEVSTPPQDVPIVTISGDDPAAVAGGNAAAQLAAAKANLQLLRLRWKETHPDVQRLQKTIKDLEAQVQAEALQRPLSAGAADRPTNPAEALRLGRLKAAQDELDMLKRQIEAKQAEEKRLRGVVAAIQARIDAIPGRDSEMTKLLRDYSTLNDRYLSLLGKQEESKVAANMESREIGEQFRFLDQARLPERPISPNRPMINMMGAFIGLGLGLAFVVLLEYRDNSFRTDDEIVSVLALPVVAVIPLMLSRDERRARRRKSVIIGAVTASVTVLAVAGAVFFFLRYGL